MRIMLALFTLAIFLSTSGLSCKNKVKKEPAVLRICPIEIVGCADKLLIKDKNYLIDVINKKAEKKLSLIINKREKKDFRENNVQVTGSFTEEKGHFPNPMANFDVFKLEDISLK